MTSYVTVHTCTMRVEKVCKVREEPAPRLAAERDALGSHCLECLAASASRDFWGFPEAQCTAEHTQMSYGFINNGGPGRPMYRIARAGSN